MTALESDNQLLVNVFSKWSQWADLKVRVDRCHVFSMKEEKTEAKQYLPKIIINRERIPPVEMEKSFDYLGKTFSFNMDTKNIQNGIDLNVLQITSHWSLFTKNNCATRVKR